MAASHDPAAGGANAAETDIEALLGPRSVVQRRAGDVRVVAGGGGYALLLQVAHPIVAGGVRDESSFQTDSWQRLARTLDLSYLLVYGRPEARAELGAALRRLHRPIRGVDPWGRAYDALDPAAYAWVHATLAEGIVRAHAHLGRPLSTAQREALWSGWLELGTFLGIREGDLPATWPRFQTYLASMIDEVLENNDVVQAVLATAARPRGQPPVPLQRMPAWMLAAAGRPLGRYGRFLASGMMPPALRAKLDIAWSPRQDRAFRAVAALNRAATPVLPRSLRRAGPTYIRLRRAEIARGPFAAALPTDLTASGGAYLS